MSQGVPARALTRSLRNVSRLARGPPKALSRPVRQYATVQPEEKDPVELDQITTLSNGIRVATEALPGHFSGVGVFVDAGSRYENDYLRGVSHIIDRLAFKSTSSRDADQMLEAIESLGGNVQCASSRESLMYQAATFNSAVPDVLGLLAETIRDPLITDEEVAAQLETADYEIKEIWSKPELILPELVHLAAYKDNTLGNPLLCPKERLEEIDRTTVEAYRQALYKPERMVVAFAGVNHADAVKLTEQYFGDMRANEGPSLYGYGSTTTLTTDPSSSPSPSTAKVSPAQQQSRLFKQIPHLANLSTSASSNASVTTIPEFDPALYTQASYYTGGFVHPAAAPPPLNAALPRLTHMHLAFESLPISHPDIYALATLQTLLGGGGSFSAGGPGKGMYSRLYTNVLNQHGWVESCISFNHAYTDSGLFGISASCAPHSAERMLDVMCRELNALTLDTGLGRLQEGEVRRAKNQLKSSLLMNLESRMVELEDLGRQVQVHGRKVGVKEMCANIEALTVEELRRVARDVLQGCVKNNGEGSGAPTLVVQETEGMEEISRGQSGGLSFGKSRKEFGWQEIQRRIAGWKLGRTL
ncbi:mitochondrial-processing peptidase subunit alpha [Rhizodiscina lignyota]|uniref:Mitochondrial-processing peptidase subunit alpha n=1 Tax=Rhizodiscina lignyota TaxID=1504668 RepID=A0A9P4IPI3_9PEZI|nr:mitochondrial-processing peptidase subunit alpha [Rhizodiscina lignyota]